MKTRRKEQPNYSFVRRVADEITATQKSLPIDLNYIVEHYCQKRGFSVKIVSDELEKTVSGSVAVMNEGENPILGILFNKIHSKTRQRFTVAHEFGHFVLKHEGLLGGKLEVIDYDSKSKEEIEANFFAALLLMPTQLIRKYQNLIDTTNTRELAAIFGVSEKACKIRLRNDSSLIGYSTSYVERQTNLQAEIEDMLGITQSRD